MAAGTAPDVFTDHLSKYPDFIKTKQLLALDDAVSKDKVDTQAYNDGLADLWVGQDGKRYGTPEGLGHRRPSSTTRRWPRTPASPPEQMAT